MPVKDFMKPVDRKEQLNVTVDGSIIAHLDVVVREARSKIPAMTRSQLVNNILATALKELKDTVPE